TLGWAGLSTNTAQLVGDIIGTAVEHLVGTMLGANMNLYSSLSFIDLTADYSYREGLIGFQSYKEVKATVVVAQVLLTGVNIAKGLAGVARHWGNMSTAGRVISSLSIALQVTITIQKVQRLMDVYNLTLPDLVVHLASYESSSSGGSALDRDMVANDGAMSIEKIFAHYAEWIGENQVVVVPMTPDSVQDDPFKWLAGGAMYNAQFAGSSMYVANNPRKSSNIASRKLGIKKEDKQILQGEDSIYVNLEPINTGSAGIDDRDPFVDIEKTKLRQYNQLMVERDKYTNQYNSLVAQEQAAVNSYNTLVAQEEAALAAVNAYNQKLYDDAAAKAERIYNDALTAYNAADPETRGTFIYANSSPYVAPTKDQLKTYTDTTKAKRDALLAKQKTITAQYTGVLASIDNVDKRIDPIADWLNRRS
ncbi:MAG: hypothetical protein U9Q38_09230, partial [Thermodesulfobacteriota bacterium]|nr:hypothetical protein [Thermodesulfobacteriota bacterium]